MACARKKLYFVFLTQCCNLGCNYCGEARNPPKLVSQEIIYSIESLVKFFSADPEPIIAFYGGEALRELPPAKACGFLRVH